MSAKGKKYKKLAKISSNHFLTANNKLQGKSLWLWAKTKANLKPEVKMKII